MNSAVTESIEWSTDDLGVRVFDLIHSGAIKAIAWDLDGTLIDNEDLHRDVLERTAHTYSITPEDLREMGTLGLADEPVWHMLRSKWNSVPVWEVWRDALATGYEEGISEVLSIETTSDIMARAHALNISQVVVTNATKRVAAASLQHLGVLGMIDSVVTVDDVISPKPDSEPYCLACSILNVPAHTILAIEDSETGIASATAAGLVAMQIADGGSKSKLFQSTLAGTIV